MKLRVHEVLSFRKIPSEKELRNEIKKKVEIAFNRANTLIDAPFAPVGNFPCVLSSSAGGTLIHEAIGHSLEIDSIYRGTSPVYAGKIGEKVASSSVTVIDDPTIKFERGWYEYDGEGEKSKKVILIENGVLKDYLFDYYYANKFGRKSNGHGRRESYKFPPLPRMGITYLKPGKMEPDEVISILKKGILVKKVGGGEVNTVNGDFVFEVEEGYWVENGKIKNPVKGATLIGNGPDILRKLKYIGNDFYLDSGTCGKMSQGVPVSSGIPTIYIDSITVGGSERI
ncbi:MAG: hypothetical protein DRI36_04900 [Caldiserica bacterium]|nr:MAG: hypothetical protein DRI36_04900 [Caldisericota bacterium]